MEAFPIKFFSSGSYHDDETDTKRFAASRLLVVTQEPWAGLRFGLTRYQWIPSGSSMAQKCGTPRAERQHEGSSMIRRTRRLHLPNSLCATWFAAVDFSRRARAETYGPRLLREIIVVEQSIPPISHDCHISTGPHGAEHYVQPRSARKLLQSSCNYGTKDWFEGYETGRRERFRNFLKPRGTIAWEPPISKFGDKLTTSMRFSNFWIRWYSVCQRTVVKNRARANKKTASSSPPPLPPPSIPPKKRRKRKKAFSTYRTAPPTSMALGSFEGLVFPYPLFQVWMWAIMLFKSGKPHS